MNRKHAIDVAALGWDPASVGELDHRLLRAPTLKLRSARRDSGSGVIYCVDLRVRRPNADEYLSTTVAHSFEHFLLEGLQRLLPENFVAVGIMGCQTGFYLVFHDEGRAERLCAVLDELLQGVLRAAAVPYARIDQCGNWRNHNLAEAQALAREVLEARADWLRPT